MSIQAPYRGRDNAPASADKATAETDKPVNEQEEASQALEAAKRERAPQDEEPEVAQDTEEDEEVLEEEESQEVPDPEEAAGILRHADYTKKTQALADQRRELESRYGGYETLDRFLTQNPQLAETHTLAQIVQMIQAPGAVTAQNQPSLSAEDRRAVNAVRAELQQERESLFFDRVEEVVRATSKKYGMTRAEEKAFAKRAVDEDFIKVGMSRDQLRSKLDILARATTYGDAQRKGQTKLVQKLKEKQRAASAGTAAASSAPEPRTERPKGWDALIRKHTPK